MPTLRDRPDTEQELEDVKAEFRYQLQGELDSGLLQVQESFAYFVFDDELTDEEMTDIFESLRSVT